MMLINKDLNADANVGIQLNFSASQAQVIRLSAPSVDATSGVKLGG
jgi:hypothetical protein